ncbi:hypothetical protein D9619_007003 [Psilocybe cf. subviscida]|uniref:HPt domain-containing protein n=1 Tax=Psilocybe cf. subviscida TaxID=2480587 RepID=A0A8H5B358_9AGAR|nr:hypothetical protein D9619_007003 [Psilocybe cf. subviscida]
MPVIQQHAPVPQSHIIPQKDAPASPKPRPQDAPRRPSPPPAVPVQDVVNANALPKLETKSPKDDLKASPSSARRSPTPTPSSALAATPVPSRPGAESAPPPPQKADAEDDAGLPDTSMLSLVDMETFEQILELDEDEYDFSRPMVDDYFQQAVQTFKDMDKAIANKDLPNLSHLGHFLKGSSAALGLKRVQDSCEKIQHYGNLRDEETETDLTSADALHRIVRTVKRVKIDNDEAQAWLTDYFEKDN